MLLIQQKTGKRRNEKEFLFNTNFSTFSPDKYYIFK